MRPSWACAILPSLSWAPARIAAAIGSLDGDPGKSAIRQRLPDGHGIHVPAIGSTSAPGPGSPVTASTVDEPDDASQKVATRVTSPVLGYMGSGNAGAGGAVLPVRTPGDGKRGVVGSFVQQFWLRPPLMSTHCPVAVVLAHAGPMHLVSPQKPQPGGPTCVCPGHGGEPASVDVAVVRGR